MMVRLAALAAAAALLGGVAPPPASSPPTQPFARREGLNLNSFVQQGPVSAHILLRDGRDPRLLVAFPAGNSGVGLWFAPLAGDARWTMAAPAQPVTLPDARGRALHGVRFETSVSVPELVAKQAVLSSVRVLRDYQALGTAPAEVLTPVRSEGGRTLVWQRDRLDGAPGYRLAIELLSGSLQGERLVAGPDGTIRLRVTALTGDTPLTPFAPGMLLEPSAAADPAARAALDFLSYREKFNAGSWRFNTYFGRDTLMSVRLLMPALRPDAVETGLRSVLERLSPDGNVAHEEDIGEFAVLDHKKADGTLSDAPTYNYAMIDSPYLLAPVARAWLVDDPRGRTRAEAFLARDGAGAALMRNIRFVATHAAPFARDPAPAQLIMLKPGMDAGEWRDSNDGLGGGRAPYDVNAVLVPAALEAADAMRRAGLLDRYAAPADRAMLDALAGMAATWRTRAAPLFAQTVPAAQAKAAVTRLATSQAIPAGPALAAIGDAPVRYNAIALDAQGRAVPIQNSDEGFALLFGHPAPEQLAIAAETIARPFPAGLMTAAGMLVANPVFASPALQARFGTGAYHGMVIWSWQQALAAAGLARQIARTDLPGDTCRRLVAAQDRLWTAIDATRAFGNSELWSWRARDGRIEPVAFGTSGGDADESNAAQLWSTVYLAVQRPRPGEARCAR